MWIYARYITMWSNRFITNSGIVGSVWELKLPFYSPYSMFLTCFQVPRPIGTGPENILVFGVHRSAVLAIEDAPVAMSQCMHNTIDR